MMINCFLLNFLWAQNTISDPWLILMSAAEMSLYKFENICPNHPKQAKNETQASFDVKLKEWIIDYPKEVEAYLNAEEMQKLSFSKVDLGLPIPDPNQQYVDPLWGSIEGIGFAEGRFEQLCPNFPSVEQTGDWATDSILFYEAKMNWMKSNSKEWEAFLNAEEVVAVKHPLAREPVKVNTFEDLLGISQPLPDFINKPVTREIPDDLAQWAPDQKSYDRFLQNWYFIFDPDGYVERFGPLPDLPESFVKNYRANPPLMDEDEYYETAKDYTEEEDRISKPTPLNGE